MRPAINEYWLVPDRKLVPNLAKTLLSHDLAVSTPKLANHDKNFFPKSPNPELHIWKKKKVPVRPTLSSHSLSHEKVSSGFKIVIIVEDSDEKNPAEA